MPAVSQSDSSRGRPSLTSALPAQRRATSGMSSASGKKLHWITARTLSNDGAMCGSGAERDEDGRPGT
jgi:hypothetical protein